MRTRLPTTFSSLDASSGTEVLSVLDVGDERRVAVWLNTGCDVVYDNADGHTFSYYIRGGHKSTLKGNPGRVGGPDRICLIPEGSSSQWEHGSSLEFVHLYVPDREMRRLFSETFDRDSRLMSVPEIAFKSVPAIGTVAERLAGAALAGNAFQADETISELIVALFHLCADLPNPRLIGGLTPRTLRILKDFVEANLCRPLRLRELAALANLSEYHFQRMFRKTFGVSPQLWILHRRISRAKLLLKEGNGLLDVADMCGFYDQSHFTRFFRKKTGLTPAAYRAGGLSGHPPVGADRNRAI